jgi:hypothetical protein
MSLENDLLYSVIHLIIKNQRQLKTPNSSGPPRKTFMALPTTQLHQPWSPPRVPGGFYL